MDAPPTEPSITQASELLNATLRAPTGDSIEDDLEEEQQEELEDAEGGSLATTAASGQWTTPLVLPQDVYAHLQEIYDRALGSGHFDRMLAVLSVPPRYTTIRCNVFRASREHIKTLLEDILKTEYEALSRPRPEVLFSSYLSDVLEIPCAGPRPLIPEKKEVLVGMQCGSAVLRGADVYAPGVRGAMTGVYGNTKVSVWADVKGVGKRGLATRFSGEKLFVGNGVTTGSRLELFRVDKPSGLFVKMTDPLYDSPPLNDQLPELIALQNLPSCLVTDALNPQPGERILDMCAAPGGKTTHIAARMRDQGVVEALERSSSRAQALSEFVARCGFQCIRVSKADASKCLIGDDQSVGAGKFHSQSFDRVLLDAPCSGLGQRPRAVHETSMPLLLEFASYQKRLFSTAVKLVRPGGVLVYSTCTLNPYECEGVVAWALQSFSYLTLVAHEPRVGCAGLSGVGLTDDQCSNVQRFDPTHPQLDTIGFFFAKFIVTAQALRQAHQPAQQAQCDQQLQTD